MTTVSTSSNMSALTTIPEMTIPNQPTDGAPICRLLNIAPEIRNRIYEYAFSSNTTNQDILRPNLPSKALLFSCRQIHREARGLHAEAHRDFWRTSHFHINMRNDKDSAGKPDLVATDQDLAPVRQFTFHTAKQDLEKIQPRDDDLKLFLTLLAARYRDANLDLVFERCANGFWRCLTEQTGGYTTGTGGVTIYHYIVVNLRDQSFSMVAIAGDSQGRARSTAATRREIEVLLRVVARAALLTIV